MGYSILSSTANIPFLLDHQFVVLPLYALIYFPTYSFHIALCSTMGHSDLLYSCFYKDMLRPTMVHTLLWEGGNRCIFFEGEKKLDKYTSWGYTLYEIVFMLKLLKFTTFTIMFSFIGWC